MSVQRGDADHFTVRVAVKHNFTQTTPSEGRGLAKTERVTRDVTDVVTSGSTKKAAIEKAIRLLQVELGDEA